MPTYVRWNGGKWPPPAVSTPGPGHNEVTDFDGHDLMPALLSGGQSPRDEVILAVINQNNPPGYPNGPMAHLGFPYSCEPSSFCGGALRVGRYKLLVGYPGWDQHYPYPNNLRFNPNTGVYSDQSKQINCTRVQPRPPCLRSLGACLNWDLCNKRPCLDVVDDVGRRLTCQITHNLLL